MCFTVGEFITLTDDEIIGMLRARVIELEAKLKTETESADYWHKRCIKSEW